MMSFSANRRETKQLLLYDGHNRKAGINAKDAAMKWRRSRRRFSRWMRDKVGHIEVGHES